MESVPQKPYKRRLSTVLIHKPMQREFTLVVISLLILSALTIGFVIHSTIREAMMGGGYRFGKISAYEVMSDVSYNLIVRVSFVLFVTILIIAVFGVFFLHRIAGPVYRFRSILHRIAQGDIPEEFQLRSGDYFTETAEDLNHVLRILKERRQRLESIKKKLEGAREQNSGIPAKVLEEIQEVLNQLK